MYSPLYFCLECKDEFYQVEGNTSQDFCTWECQDLYEERQEQEEYDQIYNEAFGRKVL